jgi:GAF domain-containing protein
MSSPSNTITSNNETHRLDAVRRHSELSINKEKQLQEIVTLACELCSTPIALITLVDETRQHFIAKIGLDMDGSAREESFCNHTIKQDDILMVPDSELDSRFVNSQLVVQEPHIRFYAGIPLETYDGYKVGSLCVIDQKPKKLTSVQQDSLRLLSKQVISNMELRQTLKLINDQNTIIANSKADYITKVNALNKQLQNIIELQSHQIRGPVTSMKGLIELIKNEQIGTNKEYIKLLEVVVNQLDGEIHEIVKLAHESVIDTTN